jgi:hypothetical protein
MSTLLWPPRPCPLCGNPTPASALVETHVGPTERSPHADVVWWRGATRQPFKDRRAPTATTPKSRNGRPL